MAVVFNKIEHWKYRYDDNQAFKEKLNFSYELHIKSLHAVKINKPNKTLIDTKLIMKVNYSRLN